MDKFICIHGHFYQPPRENAWLEDIEYQDSAYPDHDWNVRINAQCYRANALSRILDPDGWVVELVSNYSNMSFNFGPTLMSWIEDKDPQTYAAILRADTESIAKFSGHGSAIAQAYNHMIFPLANRRDKETQIVWGLRDFEKRFARSPEAMWLPETAVDTGTLEILSDHGMKYVILAPRQAKAVRTLDKDGPFIDINSENIDTNQAYLVKLPSGRQIAAFFYHGDIAQAVAFEKLLENGDTFARRLMGGFDIRPGAQLVSIATDGETFGHHHRYGDMALAYAIHHFRTNDLATITIYGEFLEKFPPKMEVKIAENTAWSCAHGVERWRSDCGDNAGSSGWHQKWRGPLRVAYDFLRDKLEEPFENLMLRYTSDPWGARNDYISVVLNRSEENLSAYLSGWCNKTITVGRTETILKAMELQRHLMLMYTSCAWFFDEVSGIETVQTMQYAHRAIELAEALFGTAIEADFRKLLREAPSNIPALGTGEQAYLQYATPQKVNFLRIAAHFAVSALFSEHQAQSRVYSFNFDVEDYQQLNAGLAKCACGRVNIASIITNETQKVSFAVVHFGDQNINAGVRFFQSAERYQEVVAETANAFNKADFPAVIRVFDKHFPDESFSLKDLLKDEQVKVTRDILARPLSEVDNQFGQIYDRHYPLIRYFTNLKAPLPSALMHVTQYIQNHQLEKAISTVSHNVESVRNQVREAVELSVPLDTGAIQKAFEDKILACAEAYSSNTEDMSQLSELLSLLRQAKGLPFNFDLGRVQNRFYQWSKGRKEKGEAEYPPVFLELSNELKVRI